MAVSGPTALLRVDSPSDLVFIKEGDPILEGVVWKETYGSQIWKAPSMPKRSVQQWKDLGNKVSLSPP